MSRSTGAGTGVLVGLTVALASACQPAATSPRPCQRDERVIATATEAFYVGEYRYPADVAELASAGYLRPGFEMAGGRTVVIDQGSGQVTVTPSC